MAQKPYLLAWISSRKFTGRSPAKLMRTIDLSDLKPYFHGRCSLRSEGDRSAAIGQSSSAGGLGHQSE